MRTGAKWVIGLIVSATALRAEVPLDDYLRVRELMGIGKFSEAMAACRVLLQTHPDQLPFYDALAEAGLYGNDLVSAEGAFRGMLREGTREDFAYYGLGLVQFHRKDYRSAATLFDRAIARGAQEPDCYKMLEYAYEQAAGVESAIRYFKLLCNRFPENPNHWYGLGLAHWQKKEGGVILSSFAKALQANPTESRYLQAYAAALSLFGDEQLSLQMIDTLSAKAEREGDYQGYFFLQSHRFSLNGRLGTPSNEKEAARGLSALTSRFGFYKWEAWTYQQIADLKYLEGDFWGAKSFSERASHAASLAQETDLWVYSMYRLFGADLELGLWLDALENSIHRVEWAQIRGDERAYLYGLVDIGRTFQDMGLSAIALDFFSIALSLASSLENDIAFMVSARFGMASALKSLGRVKLAKENLEICRSLVSGKRVWSLAEPTILGSLAECFQLSGQSRVAADLLALQGKMVQLSNHLPLRINALLDLGQFYRHLGNYHAALQSYSKAYSQSESLHITLAGTRALRGMAKCQSLLGAHSDALASLSKLISLETSNRASTFECVSPFAYNADLREDFHHYCRLLVQANSPRLAFEVSDASRLAELLDPFSIPLRTGQSTVTDSLYPAVTGLRAQLAHLYGRFAPSIEKHLFEEGLTNSVQWRNALASCELKFQRAVDKMAEKANLESLLGPSNSRSTIDLQEKLKSQASALLEYMVGRDDIIIFLVTGDTLCAFNRQIGQDSLTRLLTMLSPMMDPEREQESIWNSITSDFNEQMSIELFEILLGPVLPLLDNVKTITLVTDGPLRNLPFETLRSDQLNVGSDSTVNGFQYLIERYAIKYEMAASNLLNQAADNRSRELALIVGSERAVHETPQINETYFDSGNLQSDPVPSRGAITECEMLERICYENAPRKSVIVRNKSGFAQQAKNFEIVHLASHAAWDNRFPSNSYLVIGDDVSQEEGSILRACEISQLDLEPQLLVLSGCNTARWSLRARSYGLFKPFALKPSTAFIGSLWPVDDESTRILMRQFYTHLKEELSTAEALRQAKLDLIHIGRSDPFYWGGFILIGYDTRIDLTDHSSVNGVGRSFLTGVGVCLWAFIVCMMARPRRADARSEHTRHRDIDGSLNLWVYDVQCQAKAFGGSGQRRERCRWVMPIL